MTLAPLLALALAMEPAAATTAAPGATPDPALLAPTPADLSAPRGFMQPYAAPAAGGALRVAVPQVRPQGELPPRILAAFEQSLVVEVRKLEGVSSIGMADIKDMLSFEYQRQLLGAAADEKTLTEIGRALGVDEVLSLQLVLAEGSWVVQARRFEMRTAKVPATEQRRLKQGRGDELLLSVGELVATLYPDRALKEGKTRGVAKEALVRLFPPPLPRWAFLSTAGAAVAAAVAGGWYGLSARDAQRDYEAAAAAAVTAPVPGAELRAKEDRMDSRARTANVLYGVAGVLAVGAAVEAFFTDWHGYRAAAAVVPTERGAAVAVQARY